MNEYGWAGSLSCFFCKHIAGIPTCLQDPVFSRLCSFISETEHLLCAGHQGHRDEKEKHSPCPGIHHIMAVSYVRAFRVVAIPQSSLLAQVRSCWLCVGHSCPILTKHCSPRLPCIPALPPLPSGGCRRLCCFSTGGVTVGLVICWF